MAGWKYRPIQCLVCKFPHSLSSPETRLASILEPFFGGSSEDLWGLAMIRIILGRILGALVVTGAAVLLGCATATREQAHLEIERD